MELDHPQDPGYIPNNPEVYRIDPPVLRTSSATWSSANEPDDNDTLPDGDDSDVSDQESPPEVPSDPRESNRPRQRRSST